MAVPLPVVVPVLVPVPVLVLFLSSRLDLVIYLVIYLFRFNCCCNEVCNFTSFSRSLSMNYLQFFSREQLPFFLSVITASFHTLLMPIFSFF